MFSDSRVHQKAKVEFLFVESGTPETEISTSEPLCLYLFLFFASLFIYLHFHFPKHPNNY